MESNSIFKTFLSLLLLVIIIGGGYYLNQKYKWINFNSATKTSNTDYTKENIDDLVFNNKAYVKDLIDTNHIDINANLTNEQIVTKENVLKSLTTLGKAMKNKVDSAKKEMLNKDIMTTSDIDGFKKILLNQAYDYNNTLSDLSEKVDYNLYTIIVYNMPLLDYYYIDNSENVYSIDVNYAYLYNIYKYMLDNSSKDYCILKNNIYKYTNSNYLYKDGSLVISWMDFEKIILLYDGYMTKYSTDSIVKKEYDNLFNIYTGDDILPNSSIYNQDGVTLKEEVLQAYKDMVNNHSSFSRIDEIKNKYNNITE